MATLNTSNTNNNANNKNNNTTISSKDFQDLRASTNFSNNNNDHHCLESNSYNQARNNESKTHQFDTLVVQTSLLKNNFNDNNSVSGSKQSALCSNNDDSLNTNNKIDLKQYNPIDNTVIKPVAKVIDQSYILSYKKISKRSNLLGKDDLIGNIVGLDKFFEDRIYPINPNINKISANDNAINNSSTNNSTGSNKTIKVRKLKRTVLPYVQDLAGYNMYNKDSFFKELIYGPDLDSIKPEKIAKRTLKDAFYIEPDREDNKNKQFDMSIFGFNNEIEIKKGLRRAKKSFVKRLEAKKLEKLKLKQQQENTVNGNIQNNPSLVKNIEANKQDKNIHNEKVSIK